MPFSVPGTTGRACFDGYTTRRRFRTHLLNRAPIRADEFDLGLAACFSEGGILTQEAIAGVNGVRACLLGRCQDFFFNQIAFRSRRGPTTNRLISHLHMERAAVHVGINRHARVSSSRATRE